jgi:serine/threonine-protein kinase
MRLLLTGYSELGAIISSVNDGEVFRYINKPWSSQEIRETVSKAASIAISLAELSERAATTAGSHAIDEKPALRVLVIDDDEQTVHTVQEILGNDHVVRWGATMDEAFSILSSEDTAIVISEVKIGKEDVTTALKMLKQQHPGIITIVTTSFQDTGTIIGLINEGQVFRFLPKPVRHGLMGISLQSAIRHYQTLKIAPELARRHTVEATVPTAVAVDNGAGQNRILGYLSRIRGRNASTGTGS